MTRLWTGSQLFALMLRPNRSSNIFVNLKVEEKNYSGSVPPNHSYIPKHKPKYDVFCPQHGYVLIRNSELVAGQVGKKTLGDGSKRGLIFTMLLQHGNRHAAIVINRLAKLSARWLGGHRGFSIGIEDVTPSAELLSKKQMLLKEAETAVRERIIQYNSGALPLKPGCNLLQSLESELTGILSRVRETAGAECKRIAPTLNSPKVMAECGSKGSVLNMAQMIACVGQQVIAGDRAPNGFADRSLPRR